jgi:hypothetical protein
MLLADLRQYYDTDLRDFWREGSGLSLLVLISYLFHLPVDSRVMQKLGDQRFNRQEHLQADILDALMQICYFTSVNANVQIRDGKSYKKVLDGAPKPLRRPGDPEPVKPQKKFVSGKSLNGVMQGFSKRVNTSHITGCKGEPCGCPKVAVDKK